MPTFEYELRFLQAAVPLLERYLLSSDLYWPADVKAPPGAPPYPQLTLGSVSLMLARARQRAQTPTQKDELAVIEDKIQETQSHWRVAWGQKASADFHARLNLWRDFLMDYRESPSAHYDRYAYEVGRRVQLQLLQPDADTIKATDLEMLRGLDSLLKAVLESGNFVWEEQLEAGFPRDIYWYLYGKLPKDEPKSI